MDPRSVRVGARIEFWEVPDGPDGPRNCIGWAIKDDGFAAVGVPRAGDLVSVASLAGATATSPVELLTRGNGPFLPVAHLEHYPVPVNEGGEVPEWWQNGFTTPGVHLVFRVQAVQHGGTALIVSLAGQGWDVDRALFEYADPDSV